MLFDLLRRIEQKLYIKGSTLLSSLFFFWVLLYLMSLTELSAVNFILAFILSVLHFKNRILNTVYRPAVFILIIGFMYHDSYLPGIKQLLNQKDNLQNFSFGYIVEFLYDFINLKLLAAFVILAVTLKLISGFVRIPTLVICMLCASFFIPQGTLPRILSSDDGVSLKRNVFDIDVAALSEKEQITDRKLDNYLADFYDKEDKRQLDFPGSISKKITPFDIVVVNADYLSNVDLTDVSEEDHKVLSKFNLYLTDFNTVSTAPSESILRFINSLCGQMSLEKLTGSRNEKCELPKALEEHGFKSHFFFNDFATIKTLHGNLTQIIEETGGSSTTSANSKALYHDVKRNTPVYRDVDVFKKAYHRSIADGTKSFTYIHSASLEDNLTAFRDIRKVNHQERLHNFFVDLKSFMDHIEDSQRPTLFIFFTTTGSSHHGDKTQLPGMREIPARMYTSSTAMIRFIGIRENNQSKRLDEPTSYEALGSMIRYAVRHDIFNPNMPISLDAIREELLRTSKVCENEQNVLISFRDRLFYKSKVKDDAKWVEYVDY